MAVYRQLKAAFWESPFVMGLTHEERGFFAYLLLNPATTHSGVYKLSIQMMMAQCTFCEETVLSLIQKFVTWKKIAYDQSSHEFMVVSWMKHNRPKNPKTMDRIGKEIRETKSVELKDLWIQTNPLDAEKLDLPYTLSTVKQPFDNSSLTVEEQLGNSSLTVGQQLGNRSPIVQNQEIKKDINSSVLGSCSVVVRKEHGSSLLGLKQEEPEHKDSVSYDQWRDLDHIDLSLRGNQPGEERGVSFLDFNWKEEKQEPTPDIATPEEEIIRYLNQQLCTGYRLDSGSTRKLIQNKLAEGFQVLDFCTVIDKKRKDWKDPPFRSNLIPHILFGNHFEEYLQQDPRGEQRGKSHGQRTPMSTFTNHTQDIREVF
jgi:uncharacterized phage protein (TIGR02220 family)